MKLVAKIKFGCTKTKIENFGNFRYYVQLTTPHTEPDLALREFIFLMAKHLGVPPNRFHYRGKIGEEQVFDVE